MLKLIVSILLTIILLSLALEFNSSFKNSDDEIVIRIIPTANFYINIHQPYYYILLNNSVFYADLWNDSDYINGNITAISSSDGIEIISQFGKANYVIGYPDLLYGVDIWGGLTSNESTYLNLPLQVKYLPNVTLLVNYSIITSAYQNLAYDIWLTQQYGPTNGAKNGDIEIMIWLYSTFTPTNMSLLKNVSLPIRLNNTVTDVLWNIYFTNHSWSKIFFIISNPIRSACISLNLNDFISEALDILKAEGFQKNAFYYYLDEFDLGEEIGGGLNVIKLFNYSVILKGVRQQYSIIPYANFSYIFSTQNSTKVIEDGYIGVDPNLWNLKSFNGYVSFTDNKGTLSLSVSLQNATCVKNVGQGGFPEIIYGRDSWNNFISKELSYLPLPEYFISQKQIILSYINFSYQGSTPFNLAYDIWLLKNPWEYGATYGDLEVMIWVTDDNITPAGTFYGYYFQGYKVYIQYDKPWTLVTFVKSLSQYTLSVINISALLNYAIIISNSSNLYLEQIDLGTEFRPFNGTVNYTVNIYYLNFSVTQIPPVTKEFDIVPYNKSIVYMWNTSNEFTYIPYGYANLSGDLWNINPSSQGYVEAISNSSLSFYINFPYVNYGSSGPTVIGYPEIVFGFNIWGGGESYDSPLPLQVSQISNLTLYVSYGVNDKQTPIDVAFDIWITQQYAPTSGASQNDLELMVWLYHQGEIQPAGSPVGYVNLTVEGKVYTFQVWVDHAQWTIITLEAVSPIFNASINLVNIINYISQQFQLHLSSYYLDEIDFGSEFRTTDFQAYYSFTVYQYMISLSTT